MKRPNSTKQRDILILTDYPTLDEVNYDNFWSSTTHLEILADLSKVGIKETINLGTDEKPELKTQIATSHLSYIRPTKENPNFINSFSRKHNNEGIFHRIPFENFLFCEDSLWNEVLALVEEIKKVKPKFIIVAGKWSLYFLSARVPYNKTQGTKVSKKPLGGLASHRGSITKVWEGWGLDKNIIIYPILPSSEKWRTSENPFTGKISRVKTEKANTFYAWDLRKFALIFNDVKENNSADKYLNQSPSYNFITSLESFNNFCEELENALSRPIFVSVDIETRFNLIDCIGFSWSDSVGYCLPVSTIENATPWSLEEENYIVFTLSKLLRHENFKGVFQNGSFDIQVIEKAWGVWIKSDFDTMIAGHCLFNTLKKDLATLASINCLEYSYWKDQQDHSIEDLNK